MCDNTDGPNNPPKKVCTSYRSDDMKHGDLGIASYLPIQF